MTGAAAIFVKTPGLSPVKSRLAADIGRERAEQLHLAGAAAVAAVVRATPSLRGWFAVAEPEAEAHWPGLDTLAQGDGGLGERLARVHGALLRDHPFVLLLGADAPQLSCDLLDEAAQWLLLPGKRQVFGAAADGGFWIYGSNFALPDRLWTSVAYGRDDTGDALLAMVHGLGEMHRLPTLVDLDRADDLAAVGAALAELESPLPEQQIMADRMDRARREAATGTR